MIKPPTSLIVVGLLFSVAIGSMWASSLGSPLYFPFTTFITAAMLEAFFSSGHHLGNTEGFKRGIRMGANRAADEIERAMLNYLNNRTTEDIPDDNF